MVRIAIVEDEAASAELLRDYVERYAREYGVDVDVALFSNGLALAEDYRPVWDLILMDIEMPQLDGMSTAQRIRRVDGSVLLVFVTNIAQYAIQGYEVDAMDYVLKPVSYPAFVLKFRKALRILRERSGKQLLLAREGELERVDTAKLLFAEVADHQLRYHTTQGEFSATGTLKELERTLEGEPFVRCNSCYLVNLRHVAGVKGDMAKVGGQLLKISRPRKRAFLQAISDYYGGGGR